MKVEEERGTLLQRVVFHMWAMLRRSAKRGCVCV